MTFNETLRLAADAIERWDYRRSEGITRWEEPEEDFLAWDAAMDWSFSECCIDVSGEADDECPKARRIFSMGHALLAAHKAGKEREE